ncbi:hypothetical protein HDU96_001377 [Phlyctochytrium bullatum]|nr:hypothetical protein HDU96_001377 [Phlyctochytrium bullatum]
MASSADTLPATTTTTTGPDASTTIGETRPPSPATSSITRSQRSGSGLVVPPPPPTPFEDLKAQALEAFKDAPSKALGYVRSLFPVLGWLPRYNTTWLIGDLIAGVTVGLVVIPQAIAYSSKLAGLPAQYGLYSSFVGVMLYALFATSKDVTIGPTSVLSLLVGQTIASYLPADAKESTKITFALTLSFFTGVIQLALGLLRLGVLVDLVPVPVIAGFTTGAGIQIIIGQLPSLTGIKGINNNDSAYLVFYNWAKSLNKLSSSKYDVAFGLSCLAFIIAFKYTTRYFSRQPGKKWVFYLGLLRNGIAVVLFTAISYAVRDKVEGIAIVGTVPTGFSDVGKASLTDDSIVSAAIRAVPGVVIVSILEHIAVVKSYGRLNRYRPDDNQEFVAIGASNLIGSFVGAYPATGSFSRSAIKSQSGVRSPLAALFTGIIVLISIYTLTPAFYYIPNSVLAAIIVAAITELLSPPRVVKQLWDASLLDLLGFALAFFVTIFSSIENAIYSAVAFSLFVLFVRIARPEVKILTRVASQDPEAVGLWVDEHQDLATLPPHRQTKTSTPNPAPLTPTPRGILVFRPEESLTYPNASYLLTRFKEEVSVRFRYTGKPLSKGDRSWDDASNLAANTSVTLPRLRAIVIDLSSVNHVDYTGLQTLLDTREDLARHAGRPVPLFFASVRRRHAKVLWNLVGQTAAELDAAPGVGAAVPTSADAEAVAEGPWRFFHLSIDDAVRAADAATVGLVEEEQGLQEVVVGLEAKEKEASAGDFAVAK